MRFLIDENLSPRICTFLIAGGHYATHIRDHGMASASDLRVLAKAAADGLTLITADRGTSGGACAHPRRRAIGDPPTAASGYRPSAGRRRSAPRQPHACCGVGAGLFTGGLQGVDQRERSSL